MAEIYGGISAFKTMFDMAKGLKDINDATIRNGAVIELQEQILAAQAQQAALVARVSELEEQVRGFETWDTEKKRYELKDIGNGVMAYPLKPEAQPPEAPHTLCPDCYNSRLKHLVVPLIRSPGMSRVLICQHCGWEAYTMGLWHPEHGGRSSSRRTR